jgi:hypothetical protein
MLTPTLATSASPTGQQRPPHQRDLPWPLYRPWGHDAVASASLDPDDEAEAVSRRRARSWCLRLRDCSHELLAGARGCLTPEG